MATTTYRGHQHYIMVSSGKQTDGSPITRDIAFRMTGSPDTSPGEPKFLRSDSESGLKSWSSEGVQRAMYQEWTKQYEDQADDSNVALFPVFALSGEASGGVTRIGTTAVYVQDVNGPAYGPGSTANIKAFTLEDVGYPAIEDDAMNRLVHNVFPESVELSGSAEGPISISAALRGGGLTAAIGGVPTTPVYYRNRVFRFSDMCLLTNLTVGASITNTTGFTVAPSLWQFISDTQITSDGAVDLTSICKSIKVTVLNPVNVADSYQPGTYDANNFAVVPCLGWVRTGHSVRIEARFLYGDANSKLFRAEFNAGTQRAMEFWLKHPGAIETGAYVGCRLSLPQCDMVSYVPSPDGMGPKYVTCTWEACNTLAAGYAWRYISAGTFTTAMTA